MFVTIYDLDLPILVYPIKDCTIFVYHVHSRLQTSLYHLAHVVARVVTRVPDYPRLSDIYHLWSPHIREPTHMSYHYCLRSLYLKGQPLVHHACVLILKVTQLIYTPHGRNRRGDMSVVITIVVTISNRILRH